MMHSMEAMVSKAATTFSSKYENMTFSPDHHLSKNTLDFISENTIPVRPFSLSCSRPTKHPMKVSATNVATPVIRTCKSSSSYTPHIVDVDLGDRSYPIYIGYGLLNQPDLLQRYILNAKYSHNCFFCDFTSNILVGGPLQLSIIVYLFKLYQD